MFKYIYFNAYILDHMTYMLFMLIKLLSYVYYSQHILDIYVFEILSSNRYAQIIVTILAKEHYFQIML